MTVKMPRQALFDSSGQPTTAGHNFLVQIERLSEDIEANATTAAGLSSLLSSITNEVDGLPAFGTFASLNYEIVTQAEYDALADPVDGTIYFIPVT